MVVCGTRGVGVPVGGPVVVVVILGVAIQGKSRMYYFLYLDCPLS